MDNSHPFVLCYVCGPWAYFTNQPLENQWGDDWGNIPYEHNAGSPYEAPVKEDGTKDWEIVRLAWDGPFETPADGCQNSRWSVEMINAGAVAWLHTEGWRKGPVIAIHAGITMDGFIDAVRRVGGRIYKEVTDEKGP